MTAPMRRSVEAITLADYGRPVKARVFVFYSQVDARERGLRGAFATGPTAASLETIVGQTPWRDDDHPLAGQLPFPMLERMVQVLV